MHNANYPPPKFNSHLTAIGILALCVLLAWISWWRSGRLQPLPEVPALSTTAKPLACVSYAPFRRPGSTPLDVSGAVTAAQIEADLTLLRPLTSCIRTYGVAQGLEFVPQVVRKLGMRLRMGVWIGKDAAANRKEIDQALGLALQYKDVVEVLIVGNEVLLRKDLSSAQLAEYLQYAKARSAVPISYADVWEFWRVDAHLQAYVDWITIHVLPYWEDHPVAVSNASQRIISTAKNMQQLFPGKRMWVGETGWPVAGRQREGARPGVVQQSQLVRTLLVQANKHNLDINYIEAFDQPWKRALEGAMGGAWGLFNADGAQRLQLVGPMREDPQWLRGWLASSMGVLSGLLLGFTLSIGGVYDKIQRRYAIAVWGLAGALLGAMVPWIMDYLHAWNRNAREWQSSLAVIAVLGCGTWGLAWRLALYGTPHPDETSIARYPVKLLQLAQTALLFVTASWALVLLADPRYRGFPLALFAVPAALSLVSYVLRMPRVYSPSQAFLSWTLLLCSIAMLAQEGWLNLQAALLALMWILLAWPGIAVPGHKPINAKPPTSQADAAMSAL